MVTFLFSVHTITEAKQYAGLGRAKAWARAVDLPARSYDLARPGVAPPLGLGCSECMFRLADRNERAIVPLTRQWMQKATNHFRATWRECEVIHRIHRRQQWMILASVGTGFRHITPTISYTQHYIFTVPEVRNIAVCIFIYQNGSNKRKKRKKYIHAKIYNKQERKQK